MISRNTALPQARNKDRRIHLEHHVQSSAQKGVIILSKASRSWEMIFEIKGFTDI